MITVPEIRERLVTLLADYNEDALAGFEEWLASASWNMHLDSDLSAQRFAAEIELTLAEIESDCDLLGKKLKQIASSFPILPSDEPVLVVTSSSATFRNYPVWAFSLVDNPRVEASS